MVEPSTQQQGFDPSQAGFTLGTGPSPSRVARHKVKKSTTPSSMKSSTSAAFSNPGSGFNTFVSAASSGQTATQHMNSGDFKQMYMPSMSGIGRFRLASEGGTPTWPPAQAAGEANDAAATGGGASSDQQHGGPSFNFGSSESGATTPGGSRRPRHHVARKSPGNGLRRPSSNGGGLHGNMASAAGFQVPSNPATASGVNEAAFENLSARFEAVMSFPKQGAQAKPAAAAVHASAAATAGTSASFAAQPAKPAAAPEPDTSEAAETFCQAKEPIFTFGTSGRLQRLAEPELGKHLLLMEVGNRCEVNIHVLVCLV